MGGGPGVGPGVQAQPSYPGMAPPHAAATAPQRRRCCVLQVTTYFKFEVSHHTSTLKYHINFNFEASHNVAALCAGAGYGGGAPGGSYGAGPGGFGGGAGAYGAAPQGAPAGPAAPAAASHAEQLPGIHEIDITIQADPRVMRMTVGEIPSSASAHAQCKLPIGAIIQPMGLDDQIPPYGGCEVVNFGSQGIVRCKRCRTYINPFVSWMNNGRQWRCNVCGMVNDVPTSYFCHLDANGMRRDRDQRPELAYGSVEIQAPAEYMVRPPVAPVYFFVIDVSANAVNTGMVAAAVAAIKACLDRVPGDERSQFGLITFDGSIHFYNLKSTLSQPQMLVVSDISDLFLPCPDDLLVNLAESRAVVDALLDALPQMHRAARSVDSALGPALNAAGKVMAHLGGKMVVFCANLPSLGEAKLKHRENPRMLGTDKEHLMLKPDEPWYQNKAQDFSKLQICVDLFLCGAQYMDVATLFQLPSKTGGQLFYYPGFNVQRDGVKLQAELTRVLTRATAFEAVMRVRATRGLRMSNFYGNYFIRGTDLLALPNCTPDSVFGVEFAYDEQVLVASVISIQAALLYTTSTGERRIRVHNVALPVKTVCQEIFNSVSIDALCNLVAKQALDVALTSGLDAARARIQDVCVEILRATRGGGYGGYGGAQQQPAGMPEAIQLLPLYSMALQKNPAFRGGAEIRPDERAFIMAQLVNMPVDDSRCFIYPRMFSIHDMPADAGTPISAEAAAAEGMPTAGRSTLVRLPPVVNLSAERLTSDGIFLLENGVGLLMWVGRAANRALVASLIGAPSLEGLDTSALALLPAAAQPGGSSGDACARVNAVVAALREERAQHYLQLMVVGEGDGQNEHRFFWHLVEDRAPFPGGGMNYAEFMQHVTRQSFGG
ncbi:Sec23/Sec24 trunk domain-containing protein [Tribonema minus]|uniref:Sec23/Sec24 trunk domain-containing protein n=1 Tax=Tribonema minus TaxID=303371 RepID=A0A836CAX8_9STRA|nr:Sec23/Sec24 trunk domain-containing protein [Tribonema minus]